MVVQGLLLDLVKSFVSAQGPVAEKMKREVARLASEAERLEKEVARQKSLRCGPHCRLHYHCYKHLLSDRLAELCRDPFQADPLANL